MKRRSGDDPFSLLGLDKRSATRAEVIAARRRLAMELHPDRIGGDHERMGVVNRAADAALALLVGDSASMAVAPRQRVRRDHPSFTIDVLPAEAFEALLIVTGWLGQLADEDPPYRLEVLLDGGDWCALELVPDAAGTTVSIVVETEDEASGAIDRVRDMWVSALNLLDWDALDPAQPRPW